MGGLIKCLAIKAVSRFMAGLTDLYIRNGYRDGSESEVGLATSMACLAGNLILRRQIEGRYVMD